MLEARLETEENFGAKRTRGPKWPNMVIFGIFWGGLYLNIFFFTEKSNPAGFGAFSPVSGAIGGTGGGSKPTHPLTHPKEGGPEVDPLLTGQF